MTDAFAPRPLRIALVATARYPVAEPFVGGLASHVARLARGLATRGHEPVVFAPEGSAVEGVPVEPFCRPSGLEFSSAARGDLSMLAEPFMQEHHALLSLMLSLGRDAWGPFDIVHNHSLHYLPVAMAPAVRAGHLTTLHAPPTPWQESAFAALPMADRPAAVTVSARNRVPWLQTLPTCGVVPNGVDPARWPFRAGPEPGLAVWAGRLVPEKGPHLAIDAARAAGLRLRLVGPVHDAAYVEAEITPRLGDDVELVGHVTQAELARHLGTASVAFSTARWEEPFGLTLVEALACGTPVAAFRRGAAPDLVTLRTGRLAPPDDVQALAEAAVEAANLDRRACRAWVEAHASEHAMVLAYEALYLQLVRQPATDVRLTPVERPADALALAAA